MNFSVALPSWWPFQSREEIPNDYTETLLTLLLAQSAGGDPRTVPSGAGSSVCRAAAQLTARIFGALSIDGGGVLQLTPGLLATMGAACVYRGQFLAKATVGDDGVEWRVPFKVERLPEDRYRLTFVDGDKEIEEVVRDPFRVDFNPHGLPPWGGANAALAAAEFAAGDEASRIPNVRLFPRAIGTGGGQQEIDRFHKGSDRELDLIARGGLQHVTGQHAVGSHLSDSDRTITPSGTEANGRRIGPEYGSAAPQMLAELRAAAAAELGLPPSLVGVQSPAAGQALQAAYRHFVATALVPNVHLLQDALRRQFGTEVRLALPRELRQTDIQARARAAASMMGQGVTEADAFKIAGLDDLAEEGSSDEN